MFLSVFTIAIPLFYYYHIPTAANTFQTPHHSIDSLAINCGSHGNSTALDGREWNADTHRSTFSSSCKSKISSPTTPYHPLSSDPVPYSTARISRYPFTYSFHVNPGQKIIRFHFNPAPYPGFKSSIDIFTVKAGPFTLLSNFSPSITAAAMGVKSFIKEYCLNVAEATKALVIQFYPSDKTTYAFINGIEIVSMPAGLYYTRDGDLGAKVVGQKYHFYIDNNTALEMIRRLNVGGKTILPIEDSGMFRGWSADGDYLVESKVVQVTTLTYIHAHFAPMKVYQTTWSMGPNKQEKEVRKITWRVPVDLGFRYLVRFHFSEGKVLENGQAEFGICLNSKIAKACNDMIKWSNGNHIASCRDYVVVVVSMEGDKMQGRHDLLIAMQLKYTYTNQQTNAKLHGIEIFKLSNPDNNLAGLNLVPPAKGSKTRFSMAFGHKNAIATGMTLILSLLNIIVYCQRVAWEANCKKKGIPISPKKQCRRFSLAEIRLATRDFDGTFVIGKGGFGYVYKGLIGTDAVAIKRSNPMSDQGANEFWTEIEMLSRFRHTHLVPLLGYCEESQEMILVYEYMDHGTLADHLHKIGGQVLSWEQRLEICIGAARGLDYLHIGGGDQQRVVHRDVKSSNILLDKDWVAKISDFGLSKVGPANQPWTHVSTIVKGTFGYLDPEYFMLQRLTTKSDVYSFGVVMFEVLCGRRAVDPTLEEEQQSLAQWAQNCIKQRLVHQIVDPNLRDQIVPKSLKVFTEIAAKCVNKYGKRRPTIADVVVSLKYALELQTNTNSRTNAPSRAWWLGLVWRKLRPTQPKSPSRPTNLNLSNADLPRFSLSAIQSATRNFDESPIVVMKPSQSPSTTANCRNGNVSPSSTFICKWGLQRNVSGENLPSVSPRRERPIGERNVQSPTGSRNSSSPTRSESVARRSTSLVKPKQLSVETQRRLNDTTEQRRVSSINSPNLSSRRIGSDQTVSSRSQSGTVSTYSQTDTERSKMDKYSSFYKDESSSPSPVMKKDQSIEFSEDLWCSAISPLRSKSDDISDDGDFIYFSEISWATNYLTEDPDLFYLLLKQQYLKGKDTSKPSRLQRKLVFDTVAEILDRERQYRPWKIISMADSTAAKPSLQKIWTEFQRIRERDATAAEDLSEIICGVLRKDLAGAEASVWGDCPVEMSEAVLDIDRLIFKDLVCETVNIIYRLRPVGPLRLTPNPKISRFSYK